MTDPVEELAAELLPAAKAVIEAANEAAIIKAAGADIAELFSDFDTLVQPVEQAPMPSDDELASVVGLALYAKKLDTAIEKATEQLKALCAERDRVARELLPEALIKIGMTEFKLTSGAKIEIESKLHASITKANQEDAFNWLIETQNDDLIKTVVSVEFGRGEAQLAQQLLTALKGRWPKRKAVAKQAVNPQSLGAFLRELDTEGKEFPESTFGVHRITQAVIREPAAEGSAKGSKQPKTQATEDEE